MMRVGIVGSEAAKFTPRTEASARSVIRELLERASGLVSGHCHLGGIDIWAEEEADAMGIPKYIFPPRANSWSTGYKPRNLQIARESDIVYCITVREYPLSYEGLRFFGCYHCHDTRPPHVKSGGCWTAVQALKMGKAAGWRIIEEAVE